MIVECSKCKTSFKVDQNLISQKAKVFQCSLCKNVWAIENDQAFTKIKDKKLKEDLESIRNEIEYKKIYSKRKLPIKFFLKLMIHTKKKLTRF